jgi:aspartate dehydrogenase
MTTDAKRIGIIGLGTIGGHIARTTLEQGFAALDFVMTSSSDSENYLSVQAERLESIEDIRHRGVDLVVEAANADFVKQHALAILQHNDLLVFSLTALSDDGLRRDIRAKCESTKHRLFLPHGAILGLDGIYDGRRMIDEVSVTTTKHPRNLGLSGDEVGTLFDGSARDACSMFPRTVNVHAAVALAGIGFDATRSRIVADPTSKTMRHEIRVGGSGLNWTIVVESQAVGAVTGSYTPESAAMTVRRLLAGDHDIVLA